MSLSIIVPVIPVFKLELPRTGGGDGSVPKAKARKQRGLSKTVGSIRAGE